MFELKPLPSTLICGFKRPPITRHKWLICENGSPITTLAGRGARYGYNEAPEEKAMREKLAAHFAGQTLVSRPDIASSGTLARFEVWEEVEREVGVVVAVGVQMELL